VCHRALRYAAALAELVAHSGDRLLRVADQLTHDRVAAQDAVQDALLRGLPLGAPPRPSQALTRRPPTRGPA
jgi:DNA-directed RNA polymerase specialized sigma24 family protein